MQCASIRSIKDPYHQCPGMCKGHPTLCPRHSRAKKARLFDSNILDPLVSINDTDPVTLDKIWFEENGKKRLCRTMKPGQLFSYKTIVNGKEYQRTLLLTSIRDLLAKKILTDPFTNEKFSEEFLAMAREKISLQFPAKTMSKKDRIRILNLSIIDRFRNIGYIINPDWVLEMRSVHVLGWYNEVSLLWNRFRQDTDPEYVNHVYPPGVLLPIHYQNRISKDTLLMLLKNIDSFAGSHYMASMIAIHALAWVSNEVKIAYPDLVS